MSWIGTLLGGLIGFGASVIPEAVALVRASYFHRFQMEAIEKGHEELAQSISSQTDAINALTLQVQANCKPSWLDLISNSVRPILTYLFFSMFFLIKMSALVHLLVYEHVEVMVGLPLIWDPETSSLFAAIISFWFGSRALGGAAGTASTNMNYIPPPSRGNIVDGDKR